MLLAKLWRKRLSKVQQSWVTQYTMRLSRLSLKAHFQGAWVLATYNQIKCNMLCHLEVSIAAALSAQNSQAGTSNSQVPPQTTATVSAAKTAPVYTTTSPIPTAMQGGSTFGFPKGWDPMTGYGMHPDFFTTPVKGSR